MGSGGALGPLPTVVALSASVSASQVPTLPQTGAPVTGASQQVERGGRNLCESPPCSQASLVVTFRQKFVVFFPFYDRFLIKV